MYGPISVHHTCLLAYLNTTTRILRWLLLHSLSLSLSLSGRRSYGVSNAIMTRVATSLVCGMWIQYWWVAWEATQTPALPVMKVALYIILLCVCTIIYSVGTGVWNWFSNLIALFSIIIIIIKFYLFTTIVYIGDVGDLHVPLKAKQVC